MKREKYQNRCISCGCKTKGSDGCDPATGKCICNTKAISGSQEQCEVYSCDDNSDCSEGICWRPAEMKKGSKVGKISCFNIYLLFMFLPQGSIFPNMFLGGVKKGIFTSLIHTIKYKNLGHLGKLNALKYLL